MTAYRFLLIMAMCLVVLLTACSGQQVEHEDMATSAETSDPAFEPGAWMDMELTETRTGDTFKLADYRGQTVILEIMDPGCSICSVQLKEVKAALEILGDEATAVSVDAGRMGAEAQIQWADQYGATWALAQLTKEFGQSLMSEYGGMVLNATSTPVIIIDPSGTAHITDAGVKKSDVLVELVNQWEQ